MSKPYGNFYCWNYHHSFTRESKRKFQKKGCENKYFCNFAMPSEEIKILEFNQYQKFDKASFVRYWVFNRKDWWK